MQTKPKLPLTIWALGAVALAGLLAQFLAAERAFSLVQRGPVYSVAAAALIETAVVVEALSLTATRRWINGAGLVVSLLVSGVYNVTQAITAETGLAWWQLAGIAVGPLVALVSIGLALGEELYDYLDRLDGWREQVEQEQAQAQAEQRQRELEWEQYERERRLETELKQAELDARNRRRIERQESERALDDRTAPGQAQTARPVDRHWSDKATFLSDADRPADLNAGQLSEMAGISERTARRWLAAARNGHSDEEGSV